MYVCIYICMYVCIYIYVEASSNMIQLRRFFCLKLHTASILLLKAPEHPSARLLGSSSKCQTGRNIRCSRAVREGRIK